MAKPKYTTESAIEELIKLHGKIYDYSNFVYKTMKDKVIIICPIHGEFAQETGSHFKGCGCKKCGTIKGIEKKILSNKELTNNFNKVHNFRYDYSKFIYIKSSIKGIIICNSHGEFKQKYDHHIVGMGCPVCGHMSHWRRSEYIEKVKGRVCTFYTLRCFNENEEFYKIGITVNDVKTRYYGVSQMPYDYEVISEVKGSAGFIWDLEVAEKRKLKEFHYKPELDFKGSKSECFTKYKL